MSCGLEAACVRANDAASSREMAPNSAAGDDVVAILGAAEAEFEAEFKTRVDQSVRDLAAARAREAAARGAADRVAEAEVRGVLHAGAAVAEVRLEGELALLAERDERVRLSVQLDLARARVGELEAHLDGLFAGSEESDSGVADGAQITVHLSFKVRFMVRRMRRAVARRLIAFSVGAPEVDVRAGHARTLRPDAHALPDLGRGRRRGAGQPRARGGKKRRTVARWGCRSAAAGTLLGGGEILLRTRPCVRRRSRGAAAWHFALPASEADLDPRGDGDAPSAARCRPRESQRSRGPGDPQWRVRGRTAAALDPTASRAGPAPPRPPPRRPWRAARGDAAAPASACGVSAASAFLAGTKARHARPGRSQPRDR